MSQRMAERVKTRSQTTVAATLPPPVVSGRKPIRFSAPPAILPCKPAASRAHRSAPPRRRLRLTARLWGWLLRCLRKLGVHFGSKLSGQRRSRRKLKLLEMQQLGEKRFVAVVRAGNQKFLIGGSAASVSLLAEIEPRRASVIAPRSGQESA